MPAARPTRPARTVDCYGCSWPAGTHPVQIELDCIKHGGRWIANNHPRGAGLETHVINFSKLVWPWFSWHRWAKDLILPQLCRRKARVGIFGPSSSGKSCMCGMVGLVFYFANPHNTTVLVTSTTKDDLETRIWGEIKMFFSEAKKVAPWLPGHLTESKQIISTDGKGEEDGRDFRNGVMGKPVRKGGTWVGLGSLVGIKNENMIAIADEVHLMNDGFNDSLANLEVNPNFRGWELGNLNDLSSQLGQACEPSDGWNALADSDVSRVYETRFQNGTAIQLVGQDSPNLDYPEGAEPYKTLIGRDYLRRMEHNYGKDTPLYNMFAAGKIPRGTMENRVITRADCERHNAFEPVIWGHEPITRLYAMDISYTKDHGDRTVGCPFAFGLDSTNQMRFAALDRPLVYTPNDRNADSIESQLAIQCAAECKRWEIPTQNIFFDGTGRSSFTAALMRLMGVNVNPIEFGGTATNRPNFMNRRYEEDLDTHRKKGDLMRCDEVFNKMVTELWFAFRALVEADQCRNLDLGTIQEAERRLWELSAGNRISVEPKKDMKLRIGRSPDFADAFCVGIEGARRLGFPLGKVGQAPQKQQRWLRQLDKSLRASLATVELATI